MMRRRGSLALVLCLAAGPVLFAAPAARADGLTAAESARLHAGATVTRVQTIERGERRLVGGLTYTIVEASPEDLLSLLEDTAAWPSVLPKTRSAQLVERHGNDRLVELVQGNSLVTATYTIHLRRYPDERTVRFWLDPSRPHALDDAWGFFRADAMAPTADGRPRTLLTFGCLVDLGPGIARSLFEERIRGAVLNVPQLVRARVERPQAPPAAGAARPG